MRAFEMLNYIGAIDDDGEMTQDGQRMSELPLEPQLAKLLLTSAQYNCTDEMVTIVALLSSPNIFLRPREAAKEADEAKAQFANPDGDHLTLLAAYEAYLQSGEDSQWCWDNFINHRSILSAGNVRRQLVRMMGKMGITVVKSDYNSASYFTNIRKCLCAGLFQQVAHLQRAGHYLTVKDNQVVSIHPSSVLDNKPAWVIFGEFVLTAKNYIRTVSSTRLEWLCELAPHYFDLENFPDGETKSELESGFRRARQELEYAESKRSKKKKG